MPVFVNGKLVESPDVTWAGGFVENYTTDVSEEWKVLADKAQAFLANLKDTLPDDVLKLIDADHITNNYHPQDIPKFDVLTDTMVTKLINTIIVGGTGLKPEIEQAIFDREKERAQFANQEAKDKQASDWAESKGFSLPDGVLTAMYAEIDKKYQDDRLATSRTIAIDQAQLEQKNILAAIERGIAFLADVIKDATQIATSLMAAQAAIMNEIARFMGEVPRAQAGLWGQILSSLLNTINLATHFNAQADIGIRASIESQVSNQEAVHTNYNHNFSE